MPKKTTTSRAGRTEQSRSPAKRDLVRRSKAGAYAKRTAKGRFKEMDDVGRSQKADNRASKIKRARSTATAYVSLGLAKGLRALAATIGVARGRKPKRKARA